MNKKSQIMIFVLIAIIILFLLVLLLSDSFFSKKGDINDTKTNVIKGDSDLVPIKELLDSCLDKQLKRAVIISGLRGGFIYNKGEY